MRQLLLLPLLLLAACGNTDQRAEIAELKAQLAILKAARAAPATAAIAHAPELGQQMLELQIRPSSKCRPP